MPTNDDERREVADALRHQAKRLGPNMDAHEFANYVPDVIDPEYELRWDQMMLHLAELIDRPTCTIVESYMGDNLESVEEMPYHVLSCGHIAYGEDDPMFCPVCGAAVTDDY